MSENNASAKGTGDTQGAGATSSPPRQYRPPSPKSKSASPKGKSASPQAAEIESPPGVLPGQHWIQAAEVLATEDDDHDSALGDEDRESSTASIASSILDYRTILGRTFHSERGAAQSWIPNDEKQNEAMDINHHLLTMCLGGKLHLAPLKKDIQKVLDIGTGTGIWAIDFADEFPSAEVIGTDLSPIQPSWVPPNLKFEIEDCTDEWTFRTDSVDYVHMRYLFGSISDWGALFKEAFRVCKPGGYVESYEASNVFESDDGTVTDTSAMSQWANFFHLGGTKLGRPFTVVEDDMQKKFMEEAGFVDVQVWDFKAPVGRWAKDSKLKDIGGFVQATLEQDYEGYITLMAQLALGWGQQEVTAYCALLRREIRSGKHHPFYRQKVVWGRKPESSEESSS